MTQEQERAMSPRPVDDATARSERRFRALMGIAPELVAELDRCGIVRYASPGVRGMSGYPESEVVGRAFLDFVPAEDRDSAARFFSQLLGHPEMLCEADFRILRKDGTCVPLHIVGRNHLADDAVQAVVIRGLDESRTRAIEDALHESEAELGRIGEQFNRLVEHSISAVYMIQDARLAYANGSLARLFRYSLQELADSVFCRLVAEPDRARVEGEIERVLGGKNRTLQCTFLGMRRDGTSFPVEMEGGRAEYDGRPVIVGALRDVTDRVQAEQREKAYTARLESALQGTINAVSGMLEYRDPYTAGHQRRVGDLAARIAEGMGMAAGEARALGIIGRIHDIGKIALPAEILCKPGKLNRPEVDLVRMHPEVGHDLLKHVEFPWPVARTILEHHERLDGSGYPSGLRGESISLYARIVAVADVVESMATHRPYRPALGLDAALDEIEKQQGRLYDSAAVAACLDLFRRRQYRLVD
jgi:PAS domain S-box-containing protein